MKVITFLLALATMYSCSNTAATDGFRVSGKLDNAEGQTVYLKMVSSKLTPVDSAIIENGQFELNGNNESTELYIFHIGEKIEQFAYLVLDNQTQMILNADASNFLKSYTVENSVESQLVKDLTIHNGEFMDKLGEVDVLYRSNVNDNNMDSIQKVCMEMANGIVESEKVYLKDFIDNNTGSMASLYALTQRVGQNMLISPEESMEYWEKVGKGLSEKYPNSSQTKSINEELTKMRSAKQATANTEVGSLAPDFEVAKVDGSMMKLSDLRGQYVLLDFWAAWCRPCRGENPTVLANYNKYKDKGFTVFQVSLDKTKEAWTQAIDQDGLGAWHHASDLKYWESAPARLYNVRGIPASFLIDPEGKIIATNLRGPALGAKLSELLD